MVLRKIENVRIVDSKTKFVLFEIRNKRQAYFIRFMDDEPTWLSTESGEGMPISDEKLFDVIDEYFKKKLILEFGYK